MEHYDIAIIGGSSAGLAAAQTSGRSVRRTIVFDTQEPRNKPAAHAHNFFTRDGMPPAELLAIAREEIKTYPSVAISYDKVINASKQKDHFLLETASGTQVTARGIILATGVKDILPPIEGAKELWGSRIVHCPYCHGWEIKDTPVALIASGEAAYEMAILIYHLNKDLTILTNGGEALLADINSKGITIIDTPIEKIAAAGEGIVITFTNGTAISKTAAYMKVESLAFNSALAVQLGCELTEAGSVKVDEYYQTTIPGVWAAGDLSHPGLHQISIAAAGGHLAAVMCSKQLNREDFERSE
ncbi:Thioredoxin reductase [Chitinophaga sp. CF118]|uniref:NAD(P)/FAD-dependent oxidoreductase n=1 Tax=Chitinophaga sp. CF118 TaxID=1884367 RepID=UPI0008EDE910|nr:NAD(P)/FAD-dependent oxidoreductase [Chitinophaga sp. CF118]SFE17684.1 Thioredoxin reductase [Chitinophaga sp. CF118]